METICWKIRVDASGFFKGAIMAQCYDIIIWFKGMAPDVQVEHPGSADLSRMMQIESFAWSERSNRKVEQGDGDAQSMLATKVMPQWVSATAVK